MAGDYLDTTGYTDVGTDANHYGFVSGIFSGGGPGAGVGASTPPPPPAGPGGNAGNDYGFVSGLFGGPASTVPPPDTSNTPLVPTTTNTANITTPTTQNLSPGASSPYSTPFSTAGGSYGGGTGYVGGGGAPVKSSAGSVPVVVYWLVAGWALYKFLN